MSKIYLVKRLKDGVTLTIEEKHLASTLKQPGFELVKEYNQVYDSSDCLFPPMTEKQKAECPYCGRFDEHEHV